MNMNMNMDSTPIQQRNSASKLPIKRRTPDDPFPQSDPISQSPLKFHRIWTEPDEIRFLQGLLECSSHNLFFPRDLGIFYARFSNTMSQPYTKSQLSEKLRRLRKKFRVISTRLAKGMDRSQLSLHDRALYDLSKRLWHPDYAATSPFNGARNVGGFSVSRCDNGEGEKSGLVGVKVDFSPMLPVIGSGFVVNDKEMVGNDDEYGDDKLDYVDDEMKINGDGVGVFGGGLDSRNDQEVKLSDVNVELEGEEVAMEDDGMANVGSGIKEDKIREVAANAVMCVFDECFKEVRRRIEDQDGVERFSKGAECLRVRWEQQRIAEFEAFGNRLRLVLETSLGK